MKCDCKYEIQLRLIIYAIMVSAMKTIKEIVEAAGGFIAVAKRCDLSVRGVYAWQEVGALDKYWPALIEMGDGAFAVDDIYQANCALREAAAA